VDLYVNTRHKRLVKRADSVGRDEQNSLVILQGAEEAGDEVIALHVLHLALLHVYICLIDEEDGAPYFGYFEPFA
jgi:chloramphenicol 3-O-phosphotransferase